jgi:hypothetical protein
MAPREAELRTEAAHWATRALVTTRRRPRRGGGNRGGEGLMRWCSLRSMQCEKLWEAVHCVCREKLNDLPKGLCAAHG